MCLLAGLDRVVNRLVALTGDLGLEVDVDELSSQHGLSSSRAQK